MLHSFLRLGTGIGLITLLVVLAACGSSHRVAVQREFRVDFTPEQKRALDVGGQGDYRLRVGDVVQVRDLFNEVIRQDAVRILPDGNATFLGVGQVRAAGMTLGVLDSLLTSNYAERFREPTIDVFLAEMGVRKVYVLGEVERPGGYDHEGLGYNVISAVAAAGGYNKYAAKGSVALIRMTPEGYYCREMDLDSITRGYEFDPAILDLQPFDIIYVSRTAIGNFAVFSDNLLGALLKYTDLATDIRYLTISNIYGR